MARRRSPVEPIDIHPDLHCSVEDQCRLLGASPFFAGLSADQVDDVQRRFQQQHYQAGDVIQRAGDPATRLSIVALGVVKMARPTLDGQDVLLDFLGPGEHFGSLADLGDETYSDDVTAHTSCCILFTTSEKFRQLLQEYPIVAIATLEIVAARLRDAHVVIQHLSTSPVEQRVAAVLLHFARKAGTKQENGILIDMPLSRQDVADMTGAQVETVSRVMSEFRRKGLIDSGRMWIAVLDAEGLAEIGGSFHD